MTDKREIQPYRSTNLRSFVDSLFGGFDDPFFYRPPIADDFFRKVDLLSRTDVAEEENHFLYQIDLPGYEKKEISIKATGNKLEIKAQKSEEDKDKRFVKRQDFEAIYPLPENVSEEQISAEYNNGVLLVTLPKTKPTEKPKPKEIEIK